MARQNNILDYLENIVKKYPEKIAFANENDAFSFQKVYDDARAIGSFLTQQGFYKKPVVVFMKKHPKMIVSFFGVVYAGNYYVPIDEEMPQYRIEMIFQNLDLDAVICDDSTFELVRALPFSGEIYLYDDIIQESRQEEALAQIAAKTIDTDPIYIVFTSGSTGVPKGVVACHRSVIDYAESLTEVLGINQNSVLGNQTPLYVDACLKEIYSTLKCGATTYLIPKELFMFPMKLVAYNT